MHIRPIIVSSLVFALLANQALAQTIDQRPLSAQVSPGFYAPLAHSPGVGELWASDALSTSLGVSNSNLSLRFDNNPNTPQVMSFADVGTRWNYFDGRISTWWNVSYGFSFGFPLYKAGTFAAPLGSSMLAQGIQSRDVVEMESGYYWLSGSAVLSVNNGQGFVHRHCTDTCKPCGTSPVTRARGGGAWLAALDGNLYKLLRIDANGALLESKSIATTQSSQPSCSLYRDKSNLLRFSFAAPSGLVMLNLDDGAEMRNVGAHSPTTLTNSIVSYDSIALPGGDLLVRNFDIPSRTVTVKRIAPGRYENNQWITQPSERFSRVLDGCQRHTANETDLVCFGETQSHWMNLQGTTLQSSQLWLGGDFASNGELGLIERRSDPALPWRVQWYAANTNPLPFGESFDPLFRAPFNHSTLRGPGEQVISVVDHRANANRLSIIQHSPQQSSALGTIANTYSYSDAVFGTLYSSTFDTAYRVEAIDASSLAVLNRCSVETAQSISEWPNGFIIYPFQVFDRNCQLRLTLADRNLRRSYSFAASNTTPAVTRTLSANDFETTITVSDVSAQGTVTDVLTTSGAQGEFLADGTAVWLDSQTQQFQGLRKNGDRFVFPAACRPGLSSIREIGGGCWVYASGQITYVSNLGVQSSATFQGSVYFSPAAGQLVVEYADISATHLVKSQGGLLLVSNSVKGSPERVVGDALWTRTHDSLIRTPLNQLTFSELSFMKSGFED